MLVGIVSDIHANFPALEAVLHDVDSLKPDQLICLGDFVGYGAEPNEVVEALRARCNVALAGNHDLTALGRMSFDAMNTVAAEAARWTSDQLSDTAREFLESLGSTARLEGLTLAHASLRDPIWEYVNDFEAASANFDGRDFEIALVGHTHVPAAFWLGDGKVLGARLDGSVTTTTSHEIAGPDAVEGNPSTVEFNYSSERLILNPGSVGQPRDGNTRASWATLDTESKVFSVRRVEYPIHIEQESILAAGLPEFLAERLSSGI